MADSYFYYYPGQTAAGLTPLQTINMGRRVGSLGRQESPIELAATSLGGRRITAPLAMDRKVTITFGGIPTGALQRQLVNLCNHARRGGIFGFAADHAKFMAATRQGSGDLYPGSDLSGVLFNKHVWYHWQTTNGVGSGDIVAIESLGVASEEQEVSSVATHSAYALSVVLDGNLAAKHGDCTIREKYSWPSLRLTEDGRSAPLLTSVGDHTWALTMPCVVDDHALRWTRTLLPGTSGSPGTVIGTPYEPR